MEEAEKQRQGDERENRYPNYRLIYTLIERYSIWVF
jgi:hypothetical protein